MRSAGSLSSQAPGAPNRAIFDHNAGCPRSLAFGDMGNQDSRAGHYPFDPTPSFLNNSAVVCRSTPHLSKSLSFDQSGILKCSASASSSTSSGSRFPMRLRASATDRAYTSARDDRHWQRSHGKHHSFGRNFLLLAEDSRVLLDLRKDARGGKDLFDCGAGENEPRAATNHGREQNVSVRSQFHCAAFFLTCLPELTRLPDRAAFGFACRHFAKSARISSSLDPRLRI